MAWAKVLYGSALLLWRQRDASLAAARTEEAVAIFRAVGEDRWLAYGLALLARVRLTQARPAESGRLLDEARTVWRGAAAEAADFERYLRYYMGSLETLLSSPALLRGDAERALAQLEDSLRELEAARDDPGRGIVLGLLGLAAAQRGEHPEAGARYAQSLELLRRGRDAWALAWVLVLAGLEEVRAASPGAGSLLTGALRANQQIGLTAGLALALAGLGEVAAGAGEPRRAGQLLGKARRLLAEIDPLLTVIVPYDLPAALASARTVDPSAFDQGLADGETWSLDQAVSVAMAEEANSRSTLAP